MDYWSDNGSGTNLGDDGLNTISERIEGLVQNHYSKYCSVPNTLRVSTVLYDGLKREAKAKMDDLSVQPEFSLHTKLTPILKYQSYLGLLDIVVVYTPVDYMEVAREWSAETYEKELQQREEEQRKERFLRDYIQNAESFGIKMKDAHIDGDTLHATIELSVTPQMLTMYEG